VALRQLARRRLVAVRDPHTDDAAVCRFKHSVGEYITRLPYAMPLKGLECQVAKLVNSDTRPRRTTGRSAAPGVWAVLRLPGSDRFRSHCHFLLPFIHLISDLLRD
jgi:hypothetical protein